MLALTRISYDSLKPFLIGDALKKASLINPKEQLVN
jgi:hypothetical protein